VRTTYPPSRGRSALARELCAALVEVERLGNTSMVSSIGIARDGDVITEGRIVHIFVRADRVGEKAPIPDHVLHMLQRYGVDGPTRS
jgi:acyl-CoA thioesterase FadM